MRAPFAVNLIVTLGFIVCLVYFWGFCDNPGKFVAAAFLLIGLAQYGTHAVMDIQDMRRRK